MALQWHHIECDGVINHRHLQFLFNRFFQAQIKENSKAPRHWPLWGEAPVTGGFPHKRPVSRKMFPFDNVTMTTRNLYSRRFIVSGKSICILVISSSSKWYKPLFCEKAHRLTQNVPHSLLIIARIKSVAQGSRLDTNTLWSLKSLLFPKAGKQGAVSIRKTVLPGMAIPMLKIRRPNGRLIFNMEIAIRR